MIALTRRNAAKANLPERLAVFVRAPITDIPLHDATIDLVVSNCVINLVPDKDKAKAFNEIYRLLKPGGRVAISDLLAKQPMPDHIRRDAALLVGCVASASLINEYQQWIEEAGCVRENIVIINTEKDLNVYHNAEGAAACCVEEAKTKEGREKDKNNTICCVEETGSKASCTLSSNENIDFNGWVASYQIYAIK